MKVKDVFLYMKDYDPEEELAISWFTKKDVEDYYNDSQPLSNEVWEILIDTIGYDADAIYYDVTSAKQYIEELKAKDENSI